MIDLKLLEKNFDDIAKRLKLKGVDESSLEEIKNLFKEKKELKTSLDILLEKRNTLSKQIGSLIKVGKKQQAQNIKQEVSNLKEEIAKYEEKLKSIE